MAEQQRDVLLSLSFLVHKMDVQRSEVFDLYCSRKLRQFFIE